MAVSQTNSAWSHDINQEQPSYYFTIKEMRREQDAPTRYSSRGWFLPAKALGHNVAVSAIHFQHLNGSTTVVPSIPYDAEVYGTYSIYIYNATIWTINYDATNRPVHNGEDTSGSSGYTSRDGDGDGNESEDDDMREGSVFDGPPEVRMEEDSLYEDDWVSMSFNHRNHHVSYAGRRKQNWRLCVERRDQEWARLILPDPYMAQTKTNNRDHGGLIGDLPLLIGLVALAVGSDQVSTILPAVMLEPWQFRLNDPLKRGDGWWDGRGLVVTVYVDPRESSSAELRRYECDEENPILP